VPADVRHALEVAKVYAMTGHDDGLNTVLRAEQDAPEPAGLAGVVGSCRGHRSDELQAAGQGPAHGTGLEGRHVKSLGALIGDGLTQADMQAGVWVSPEAGAVKLADYAERWVTERPRLRPRTAELYRGLLRRHVVPWMGDRELSAVTLPVVGSGARSGSRRASAR
jgi:Phage integrase, N-terminal SAM-like domain